MSKVSHTQIESLRLAIDALVRVFKITDSLKVDPSIPKLNPPDVQALLYISKNPHCISNDVSHFLGTSPTTTSALIDRLVRRGLILRGRTEENRRIVQLTCSADGERVAKKVIAEQDSHCEEMLRKLSAADRKNFLSAINTIVAGLD